MTHTQITEEMRASVKRHVQAAVDNIFKNGIHEPFAVANAVTKILDIISPPQKVEPAQDESLRDIFAITALQGLLSGNRVPGGWSKAKGVERISRFAYEYADGMLKARSGKDTAEIVKGE